MSFSGAEIQTKLPFLAPLLEGQKLTPEQRNQIIAKIPALGPYLDQISNLTQPPLQKENK